ncbi:MAG: hypothetical protein HQM10_09420 [Candidatus Riflebacteria bacterium]|nr:hypothetical protein [Candidatus Riflebacteria bacterium]
MCSRTRDSENASMRYLHVRNYQEFDEYFAMIEKIQKTAESLEPENEDIVQAKVKLLQALSKKAEMFRQKFLQSRFFLL